MCRSFLSCMLLLSAVSASAILTPLPAYAWDDVSAAASDDLRLGAHVDGDALQFGLFAPDAEQVDLLLFDDPAATVPRQIVPLRKVGDAWRIKIQGTEARSGLLYLYQAR